MLALLGYLSLYSQLECLTVTVSVVCMTDITDMALSLQISVCLVLGHNAPQVFNIIAYTFDMTSPISVQVYKHFSI